jgi:hypothetical protein
MVLGICPEWTGTIGPHRKSQREDPTEDLPPALCMAWDWKLIGILTGTMPDCRPQKIGTSPAFGWSERAVKPSRSEGESEVKP